jgi:hypothetical protein
MRKRIALGAALAALAGLCPAQSLFDARERAEIKRTYKTDVRMDVGVPPYGSKGRVWQVRLTATGSKWLYTYEHSQPPEDSDHDNWQAWIDNKIAFDRAAAAKKASALNGNPVDDEDSSSETPTDADFGDMGSVGGMSDLNQISGPYAITINGESIENPGPMPQDLKDFMSDAGEPIFAAAVKPHLYKISFGDDAAVSFIDQAPVPERYLYFRASDGVISGGTPLKTISDDDISNLCSKAGIDDSTWHVMRAVSSLEGGFDSINTYDTGYISVGFIQFTTGSSGAGSLAKVLLREKQNDPSAFASDFKKYGIDVTDKGVLDVYDPKSDDEEAGANAVQFVIHDKRLSAAFVHAGKTSSAFKVAQLQLAKDRYYAGDDTITLKLGGTKTPVRVRDVVKSEAGLAILMDRKVNTGGTGPLNSVMQRVADECQASCAADLANHEDEIVSAMKFRRNFLEDLTLSQPGETTTIIGSRGGTYPRGRGGKKKGG